MAGALGQASKSPALEHLPIALLECGTQKQAWRTVFSTWAPTTGSGAYGLIGVRADHPTTVGDRRGRGRRTIAVRCLHPGRGASWLGRWGDEHRGHGVWAGRRRHFAGLEAWDGADDRLQRPAGPPWPVGSAARRGDASLANAGRSGSRPCPAHFAGPPPAPNEASLKY